MMEEQIENVYLDVTSLHDLFPVRLFSLMTLHSLSLSAAKLVFSLPPRSSFLKDAALCPLGCAPFCVPQGARLLNLCLESIALTLNFISSLISH